MSNRKTYYQEKIQAYTEELKQAKRNIAYTSLVRFILFLAAIIFPILLYKSHSTMAIGLSVILLIAFAIMIKYWLNQVFKKNLLENKIQIYTSEIQALSYNFSSFDNGKEFEDINHNYAYDIDLFGENSLFQMINRTVSYMGKQRLAQLLKHPFTKAEQLVSRQKAINELTDHIQWRTDFCALGMTVEENPNDIPNLIRWANKPSQVSQKRWVKFFWITSALITTSVGLLAAVNILSWSFFSIAFLLQLFLVSTQLKKTNEIHEQISRKHKILEKYAKLFHAVEKLNFTSTELLEIQSNLIKDKNSANKSILSLSKIVNAFDSRLNIVVAILFNGLFLWDIYNVYRLEAWKKKNRAHIQDWFNSLAKLDVLISGANFAFNNPEFCFPEFSNDIMLNMIDAGHPFLSREQRVCNNFNISKKGEINIITGANMAGKSTFLRTIGINIILATAGLPVCAKKMILKPLPLYTSMRTSDSLQKNESYFYTELKRLKHLVEKINQSNELFILLDEILKGTNSIDKQKGSMAFVEILHNHKATAIIATHDLALGKLEEKYPNDIHNFCFEIEIEGSKISFDYKLYKGITQKMNASLLMKQMGILDSGD